MTSTIRDTVKELFSSFAGQQAVLTIPRPFLALVDNDHLAALVLSQCVYWSDRTTLEDRWFAKSYKEWQDELGMTERQVRRAVAVLKTCGLETVLRRSMFHEGAATLHYRLDLDIFAERVLTKVPNGGLRNVRTDPDETAERSLSEITSKTTSEKDAAAGACEDEPEARPAIYAVYEANIGALTPIIADQLKAAVADYPAGWVEDAITEAVTANVRRWKYVAAVLQRWKVDGRHSPRPNGKTSPSAPAAAASPPAPQVSPFRRTS